MAQVGVLAFAPRWFRRFEGVAACRDDGRNLFAEALADRGEDLLAALVLGGVVQEGGDGLGFGPAASMTSPVTERRWPT